MLMSSYQNSIDAKSRMIIPSKFRDELGFKCVITKGLDKCLYIYPLAQWEILMAKLAELPTTDPNVRGFTRHFYANAVESEIDSQGRLTLPQDLREYANICKELTTVGSNDKIEVWSREEFEDPNNNVMPDITDISEGMMKYDINL